MSTEITTLGLDPSLSHGVLARGTWAFDGQDVELKEHTQLYAWGKQKSAVEGLGRNCTPEEIADFGENLLTTILLDWKLGIPLAIDFNERAVMWRGQAVLASKVSFLVGYLMRGFQARGTPVIILTPQAVRDHFGLKNNAKKETVWEEVDFLPERANGDTRDSLLLSYILAASLYKRKSRRG